MYPSREYPPPVGATLFGSGVVGTCWPLFFNLRSMWFLSTRLIMHSSLHFLVGKFIKGHFLQSAFLHGSRSYVVVVFGYVITH